MKPRSFLLFTLLFFFLYTSIAAQKINANYCTGYITDICSLVYDPHCGSDGNTYMNKCAFCYAENGRRLQLRYHGECEI